MMKRKLFFWLDKLKITRTERQAISVLLIVLLSLVLMNTILTPRSPFDKAYYRELDKRFNQRVERMNQREQQRLVKYRGERFAPVSSDTLPSETGKTPASPGPHKLINVNTADVAALQNLQGIGATYAQRIIRYRGKKGAFKRKEELLQVKGIGITRLEKIKPFITVGDSTAVASQSARDSLQAGEAKEPKGKNEVPSEHERINVNTADAETLQKLPGIGPAYAGRIIEYREQNGNFKTKDELLKINGIGKMRLGNLKPFIKLTDQ